jgi:hypothetical protein
VALAFRVNSEQGRRDPVVAGHTLRDAERAAEKLSRDLSEAGFADEFIGLRAVRNVAGRPVVQLGTVDPEVAHRLGEFLCIASTRTLYIVRTENQKGAEAPPSRVTEEM